MSGQGGPFDQDVEPSSSNAPPRRQRQQVELATFAGSHETRRSCWILETQIQGVFGNRQRPSLLVDSDKHAPLPAGVPSWLQYLQCSIENSNSVPIAVNDRLIH